MALAFVNCITHKSNFKFQTHLIKIEMQTQLIKNLICQHRVQFLYNDSAKTLLWHLQGSILQEENKDTTYHSRDA